MKKKALAILLTLCCVLPMVLTGCGGGGNGGTSSGERVTITVGVPQNANVTSYDDNAFTRYLEEVANVDLEFVFFPSKSTDYVRQLTLMAAANETMPDVLWGFGGLSTNARNEFGQSGYLMDLTDLIEKYAPDYKAAMAKLSQHDQDRILTRMKDGDGAIYGMPQFLDQVVWDDLQGFLFINQDWLDTLGLKQPETIDELYTVLKAFKEKDPNGNRIADEIPLYGKTSGNYTVTTWIINAYVYFNDTYDLNVTNGKLWAPYTTDEYRQALIFLNKLCKEGLLSDLSFSAGASEMKAMVTPATGTAQVGIWAGHPQVYADGNSPILEQYQPYAGLQDETGKGGYYVLNPKNLSFPLMITTDCQNPEAAMRLINVFYQDETVTRQRHGEKGVDWIEENGTTCYGDDGHIKVVNSAAFFKGSQTWCSNGGGIMNPWNYLAIENATTQGDQVVNKLQRTCYETILKDIVQPTERCEDLVYTPEQYEQRSQYSGTIRDYWLEQRNLFILGTLDPSNDAQWNNYLNELNRLGLQEYIDLMQQAYEDNLNLN
ncbi:MAG: extracellular solute-binding protein [Oscillospiraceae bacterium]|nr:extracellular solute-binding protein [Oscillospiraceae bacterium]